MAGMRNGLMGQLRRIDLMFFQMNWSSSIVSFSFQDNFDEH